MDPSNNRTRGQAGAGPAAASPDLTTKPRVRLPPTCGPPQPGVPTKQLVWIIFGATGHMGRSLVQSALAHGDLVAAVGRVHETTAAAMAAARQHPGCLPLVCDMRSAASVAASVRRAAERFGRVDCVANCAGYGVIGACEDQDDAEIRNQFETNFMGTLHALQAALPLFRRRGAGRFLVFSSTAGALAVPGLGPYCATKYAVEGLVEAMLYEAEPLGVRLTLVEPGFVRRDAAPPPNADADAAADAAAAAAPLPMFGHLLVQAAGGGAYAAPTAPALHPRRMVQWLGDRQPTSAVRCAELVWQLGHCAYPPLRLLLGSYAVESIRDRLRYVTEEMEDWGHLNFPSSADDAGEEDGEGPADDDGGGGDGHGREGCRCPGQLGDDGPGQA